MKRHFSFCILLFFTVICIGQSSVKKALKNLPTLEESKNRHILILGCLHFNFEDNVSDVKGENNFDITSEKRQKELREVIDKIKLFKPTKIAVEKMVSDQNRMDSLFYAFKNGTWMPGKNETYHLGFRLAKELGIDGVSCVDTRPYQIELDTTIDDLENYAQSQNQFEKMHAYDEANSRTNAYFEAMKSEMILKDYLIFLNNQKTKLRYKQFFLTGLVDLGAGDKYFGADLTGYWYRRNTRIFTNIKKLAEREDERILVIYGNSHAWVLEELFEASPEFKIVPVEKVLK